HCSLLKSPRFMSVKWLRSPIFQYTTSLKTRPSPPQGGKGDFEKTPVPPFLRGARGDLDLIVKQQSLTGFDVKLTPIGTAQSVST
ncbi:hypothetical protein, partial [Microcoleus sp.]|uniref:hypothetical protein n=1 Tax=Microcoleus sp. TaxID=44472 RepID=UPI0035235264